MLRGFVRKPSRVVLHLHGGVGNPRLVPQSPFRRIVKRLYDNHIGNWMMKSADCIISADEFNAKAAAQLFNIPLQKIPVIHNGIELAPLLKIKIMGIIPMRFYMWEIWSLGKV